MKVLKLLQKISVFEYLLFFLFFLFSLFLMWKTFRLDASGNMQIVTKAWSDFAATIPLIRSFSFGYNFPPEYPIFAGEPIRYHFIFYLLVGILEKIGLPINWALNIPSAIGFTLLLMAIFYLGRVVFKSRAVGLLSVVLFLFNGSLSYLEFFKAHPLSANSISDIASSTSFSSFGPYDGKTVSAFWNLNIYTNQRHLASAYAAFIFLLIYIYKKSQSSRSISYKKVFMLGAMVGLFPFVHYAVFGMLGILLGISFFLFRKLRKEIVLIGLVALIIAVPQILYMGEGYVKVDLYNPGYLIKDLNTFSFIRYWFLNLGFSLILTPVGFFLADKDQRKVFIPFLALFAIGNIFQFSPEIAANHKFFNLFIIGANIFISFLLIKIWNVIKYLRPAVIIITLFLTLSGILDFFPIYNDSYITIEDVPNNRAAAFITNSTPRDSVFLNSSFLYHPASLAGRKILMGWPYFPWSAGYDTDSRGKLMTKIYKSNSKSEICETLKQNHVDYFTIQDTSGDRDFANIDLNFFKSNFKMVFDDPNMSIISVSKNCL